nr:MAG TPA: hypothetical protein [Caudoviricetes sp.]
MWLAWWIETFKTLFYATRKGLPFIWRPYFYFEDLEGKI